MSEPFAQYPHGQYGQYPPPPEPPRRHRSSTLLGLTATALLAGGVGAGVAVGLGHGSSAASKPASASASAIRLTSAQIADKTDPGLVDVVSTVSGGTAEGTGIVLSASGEILTNNHVINGATSVTVTDIGNGKTYTASVVGYDESQDVAVLQLSGASGLAVAPTGDSSTAAAGDDVTALGNAGGKGGTPSVAAGTITAINQSQTAFDESTGVSEHLTGLIETNADIEPGDSGGPLVSNTGQIIGMDTAAVTGDPSGGSGGAGSGGYGYGGYGYGGERGSGPDGSGSGSAGSSGGTTTQAYAIPINTALSLARQIAAGDASSTVHTGATAFIGVAIDTQASGDSGTSEGGSIGGTVNGAEIGTVEPGSPAAEAGLSAGDVVTAINGKSVASYSDVSGDLVSEHPGDTITVTYTSADGQSQTTHVTLASGPAA
jgi:S1-C subfamily serine protease